MLPHRREGRSRGADLQPLDVVGLANTGALRCDGAGEPGVGEHHDICLLNPLPDVLHEWRGVEPSRTFVIAHQSRHERCAEGAHLAAGIVEGKGGDVELTDRERVPLLIGFEQGGAGIDLDIEPDIGGLRVARDDLHHLVARIALAAGKLMRGLERLRLGGSGKREERHDAGPYGCGFLHGFPLIFSLKTGSGP